MVKNPPAMREVQELRVRSLGQKDPLEEGMATQSSVLAWRVPRTEGPGSLQSTFLPGESHGQRGLEACSPCSSLESPTDRGAWKPAVHILAWRVPRTEEPGSLWSMFLPGESHGQRGLEACGP